MPLRDLVLKGLNTFHRTVLTLSRGSIGWKAGGMPALQLITVGRRSGEKHAVMLTSPVQVGESMVVVASRGGDERHPAWFLNLEANPDVEVVTKAGTRAMRARVATPQERERLWPQVAAKYETYGKYQAKTQRVIPLVYLDPV